MSPRPKFLLQTADLTIYSYWRLQALMLDLVGHAPGEVRVFELVSADFRDVYKQVSPGSLRTRLSEGQVDG